MVTCPVCSLEIELSKINSHLDSSCALHCPPPSSPPPSSSAETITPAKKPKLENIASIFQPNNKQPKQPKSPSSIKSNHHSHHHHSSSTSSKHSTRTSPSSTSSKHSTRTSPSSTRTVVSVPPTPPTRRSSVRTIINSPAKRPFTATSAPENGVGGSRPGSSATIAKRPKPTTTAQNLKNAMPLAERMRPKTLNEICGQELVGENGVLRGLIESKKVPSIILWGSAGCGKTTIARVIAATAEARFVEISATASGVGECKKVFQEARAELALTGRRTILFCDEIHRFTKSQQDVFLFPVERGEITLIGATTENPSFKIQTALLSRCRVFTLTKLSQPSIELILHRAVASTHQDPTNPPSPILDQEMLTYLARFADGDARTALNLLELSISLTGRAGVTREDIKQALTRTLVYDRAGDAHYDAISAFHKSIRGSSPDGALFWLARMLAAGEDPLFIARRMVVMASEDIGLADNSLLPLATACFTAVQQVGLPEARINMAHCAVALAQSKKSTRAYRGLAKAQELVEKDPILAGAPVPLHLRNAPTRLLKELGCGKEYKYNPDYCEGRVKQEYLPPELKGVRIMGKLDLGSKVDPELEEWDPGLIMPEELEE